MPNTIKQYLDSYPCNTSEAKKMCAKATGISWNQINNLYQNPAVDMRLSTAILIAKFLNVAPEKLWVDHVNSHTKKQN